MTPRLYVDRRTGEAVRRYTDAETLFLRSIVGRVAGAVLFQGYGKVAIVTGMDPACVALAGAAYAASRADSTKIIVYSGDANALAREIAAYGPDAVFIAFGGDAPSYAISQATRDVFTALKNANYRGDTTYTALLLTKSAVLVSLSTVLKPLATAHVLECTTSAPLKPVLARAARKSRRDLWATAAGSSPPKAKKTAEAPAAAWAEASGAVALYITK